MKHISVKGARENNLRGIDINIPHEKITVITGISGSGKSSLAFDTIYREGERRFIETLSPYARQFFGTIDRPRVDAIEWLPPAISISQEKGRRGRRSTAGTITGIYDFLRLLMARGGSLHCPVCKKEVESMTQQQIKDHIFSRFGGKTVSISAPIVRHRKGEYRSLLQKLTSEGFVRVRIDGNIEKLPFKKELKRYENHTIEVIIDRIRLVQSEISRVGEAIERALGMADGLVSVSFENETLLLSGKKACIHCGHSFSEVEPRLFSFNSPYGWCPECRGIGERIEFTESLVVPDPEISIKQGAIRPFTKDGRIPFSNFGIRDIERLKRYHPDILDTPWKSLPPTLKELILRGDRNGLCGKDFKGVIPSLEESYEMTHLTFLERFALLSPCPSCKGTRLNENARSVKFHGINIAEISSLPFTSLFRFLCEVEQNSTPSELNITREILKELKVRTDFVIKVGLGYLSLDRSSRTLSSGELRRLRVARQMGSGLRGLVYILDEPTIGLHYHDMKSLLGMLEGLKYLPNTLLLIEHDRQTILNADYIVELGPRAGDEGGKIVNQGKPREFLKKDSITSLYLRDDFKITPSRKRRKARGYLTIEGLKEFNIKGISVEIPLGNFVCITGVSGSGKSTLLERGIRDPLMALLAGKPLPSCVSSLKGYEEIGRVVVVDQSPIGRTPRSNPATYTGAYTLIRKIFESLPLSKMRGYRRGRFSFNLPGGRCEECAGAGVKEIDLEFLPSVRLTCPMCKGARFTAETLEVKYRGKSIKDILDMRVEEALHFFEGHPLLKRILGVMNEVGLSYLKLGQPSTTLSGGEAQRIKLSRELWKRRGDRRRTIEEDEPGDLSKDFSIPSIKCRKGPSTLYLLDEPTTGLHPLDVKNLLHLIDRIVDEGNSVIAIEHNLDFIKCADYIIDMGPLGGDEGGKVVACGTPEELIKKKDISLTALYLENESIRKDRIGERADDSVRHRREKGGENLFPRGRGRFLEIKGARKNNLKGIDLKLPLNSIITITGPSGSGKSSLAIDIISSEGQRRYLESLSSYVRRFFSRVERPPVDSISGISPTVAVMRGGVQVNPRSIVATASEIYDYMRIIYARIGIPHCPRCSKPLKAWTVESAAEKIIDFLGRVTVDELFYIASPINMRGEDMEKRVKRFVAEGWRKVLFDGEVLSIEEVLHKKGLGHDPYTSLNKPCLIIDRLKGKEKELSRIVKDIEDAYSLSGGEARFLKSSGDIIMVFRDDVTCPDCGWTFSFELDPTLFSFNSWKGSCERCGGVGGFFSDRLSQFQICPSCSGKRLKEPLLHVRVGGKGIMDLLSMDVASVYDYIKREWHSLKDEELRIIEEPLNEVERRLAFLKESGIDYITLDRPLYTLSGGEIQRLNLSMHLNSKLTGVIYVLDEPTIGLHPVEVEKILNALRKMRDRGNTVIIVEQDLQVISASDFIVELGPEGGERGGEVVAIGDISRIRSSKRSRVAPYLLGEKKLERIPANVGKEAIVIHNATLHNLKGGDFSFPVGNLIAVTGVSGAGKSTLCIDLLAKGVKCLLEGRAIPEGMGGITLPSSIKGVRVVDQSPPSVSRRSTVSTYSGVWDHIRMILSQTTGARESGFGPSRFSYNHGNGRCEVCKGLGFIELEMHFISNQRIRCETCSGRRFNEETLRVRYRSYNANDILELTVAEALELFENHRFVRDRLALLDKCGLSYIKLGQPISELSAGECQRLKLSRELSTHANGLLYVLDEPTVGLSMDDMASLLKVLDIIRERGNTIVVIEQNMEFCAVSDYIIDLGPGGGQRGGYLIDYGRPEEVMERGRGPTALSLNYSMKRFSPIRAS